MSIKDTHHFTPAYRILRSGKKSFLIHRKLALTSLVLLIVCIITGAYNLNLGSFNYTLWDITKAVFGYGPQQEVFVVQNYRLPRVVIAFFAGASLGVSGAIFQSLSRNPLGSPDIVGFTQGAATGAIIQIVVFGGGASAVALTAFFSGIATALIVYLLSRTSHNFGSERIILVGIGMGATLSALNALVLVRGDLDSSIEANLWRTGSLEGRDWANALPIIACAFIAIPLSAMLAKRLTMIEQGDELAAQLGIPVEKTRFFIILLAVALVSVATASCGPIAFIPLAAPQLLKRLAKYPQVSIFGTALMGSTLLMIADAAVRSLPNELELPVGRVTGLIGGMYMIWLISGRKKKQV
ncbi:iron chelate uptake ABC transporter family permease subunit [Actinomycetaceae bacterium TAE3-ERU4]|nr:iron chelate uptake ABC transporter family permease subunit [Actinomycetaceae bacterium TAE3-ERU4]